MTVIKKEMEFGGKTLSLETGRMATQADGAVLARLGDTCVLCTAVWDDRPIEALDFLPISVHYFEKSYAAGRFPGGFVKREGKPSDHETLVSRLIDRPLRPLFPDNLKNETQIICTVLSHDDTVNADIVSMIGASAALSISGIPCKGSIGAVRLGIDGDDFIINPNPEQIEKSPLELVVAGNQSGLLMVESQANELPESKMVEALEFAHKTLKPVAKLIDDLAKAVDKPILFDDKPEKSFKTMMADLKKKAGKSLREAYDLGNKKVIRMALRRLKDSYKSKILEKYEGQGALYEKCFRALLSDILRKDLLKTEKRLDGRGTSDVRALSHEVEVLPKVHGSALFTRGETQALVVTTLGTAQDEQISESLAGETRETFMLHYNFLPFCVGEADRLTTPSRREIGHGKLALKALKPLMPAHHEFPYTVRLVSEVLQSHGSSSMATVCAGSLALMDAGVPLKSPVAGIAMGLVKEGKKHAILSDITGDEDALGDMDFKVAGTEKGITALQMDIKIDTLPRDIMEQALNQAKEGRLHILNSMNETLKESRVSVNDNAPMMEGMSIQKNQIKDLIGPGGKTIRELCDRFKARIDVSEDGKVTIAAFNKDSMKGVKAAISALFIKPEIGKVYEGTVCKVLDFGAFVTFMEGRDGLVHISELSEERVENVTDIINQGDKVKVRVKSIEKGKVRLTLEEKII